MQSRYVYTDDPQSANLFTPVNNSPGIKFFIDNLPINRKGVSPLFRGLEVGMAHGYWLFGPFALLGPLRSTPAGPIIGLIAAGLLVVIATVGLSLYATAQAKDDIFGAEGWSNFASGFLIGGVGGAIFAFGLFVSQGIILNLILGRAGAG
jgi:photosystem I subunit XI